MGPVEISGLSLVMQLQSLLDVSNMGALICLIYLLILYSEMLN